MPAPAVRPSAVSPGTVPTLTPASYVVISSKDVASISDPFTYTITGAVAGDILIVNISSESTGTTPTVTLTSGAMTLLSSDTWSATGGGSAHKSWILWKALTAGDLATPGVTNIATVAMATVGNAVVCGSIWTGGTTLTKQQFTSTEYYPAISITVLGFTPTTASKKQIVVATQRVNGGAGGYQNVSKGLTFRVNNGAFGAGVGSVFATSIADNGTDQLKPIPYRFNDFGPVGYSQIAAYVLELT